MGLVFVGGIHGVGKSTVCQNFAPRLRASHFTASELIRRQTNVHVTTDKSVSDVDSNQQRLIDALNVLRQDHPRLVLDGHFCVLRPDHSSAPVPVSVFRAIRPVGLAVLTAEPDLIKTRLHGRDNIEYPTESLRAFQLNEVNHAKFVAHSLNVPLLVTAVEDAADKLEQFALAVLGGE